MRLAENEILFRSNSAWAERDLWRTRLQQAYELACPYRNPYQENNKGPSSTDYLFDSTALNSVPRVANRIMNDLMPPGEIWFDLKAGPLTEKDKREEINSALDKFVELISVPFRSGPFVLAVVEYFLDLLVGGMAAMLVLENNNDDSNPVTFNTVSQAEVAIEEDANGAICGVYRKRKKIKIRMITRTWDDAQIPAEMQKLLQTKNKGKDKDPEVELLEATYHDPKAKTWYYDVLWINGNEPVRIVERSYDDNPWQITRWSKIPGCAYGPGPVLIALADIKTANKTVELILTNAALAIVGIHTVADDGVTNPDNIRLAPGALITVKSNGGGTLGASLQPLQTGRNFDVGQMVLDDLRGNIKAALLDNALPAADKGVRSATEIVERMRENIQDFGGAVGRITSEFIVPSVRRVTNIMAKRGYVPNIKIDQLGVKVQVNSPLARLQSVNEVENVVRWLQLIFSLAGPEALTLAAVPEKLLPWLAERMSVPGDLARTEIQIKKSISKMAEAAMAPAAPETMRQPAESPSTNYAMAA